MTLQLPSLNKFWKQLRNHDWTFEYSDDHSVWRRGSAELSAIREVVEAGGEEYKKLFEEYSAYAWRKDDSIKQPKRPGKTREDQNNDREMISNIAESLELASQDIWSVEADEITDATQLWKLYNPLKSMLFQIKNILDDKSKSAMWDTVSCKNYKKLKQEVDELVS